MHANSRIPRLFGMTRGCVILWLESMYDLGLLYHLDDDPQTIINVHTDERIFTDAEADEVFIIVRKIRQQYKGDVFSLMLDIIVKPVVEKPRTAWAIAKNGLPRSPWSCDVD